ncbi:MAG: protein kinase, partial [Myxococcota bacterium]|nr:protein kinase [Myxococcota bacterium]
RMQALQTQAGIIKGKFYYMSPEQAHGQKLDRRCDVYAAGMVMYELLAGRPAYDELGDVQLFRQVRAANFPPPSHWAPDMDPELERIVMQALHKNPRQRFQSARRLQAAIVQYMRHKYKPVTKFEAAEFLASVLSLGEPMQSRGPSPDDSLRREEFSADEASLIFDASHLAQIQTSGFNPFNEAQHDQGFEDNPFADANEATHVYMQGDNNPFAIPDEIVIEEDTAPRPSWGGLLRGSDNVELAGDFESEATVASAYSPLEPINKAAMPELGPREVTAVTKAEPSLSISFKRPSGGALAANGSATVGAAGNIIDTILEPENRPRVLAVVAGFLLVIGGAVIAFSGSGDDTSLEQEANAAVLPDKEITEPKKPKRVFVSVNTIPDGAKISVNGEVVGEAPTSL